MKYQRIVSSACAAMLPLCMSMSAAPASFSADRANAKRVFAPLAKRLAASGVPVFVPGTLPVRSLSHVLAQVVSADRSGYSIELDFSRDCDGRNVCHVGRIEGRYAVALPHGGEPVTLAGGTIGMYTEGTCAAYCNPSMIRFMRSGYAYAFSEQGSLPELKRMTSSMIRLSSLAAD